VSATATRAAAGPAGRDADALLVVARANVPLVADPLGEGRPFLGGSPAQIVADLRELEGAGVDQVFFFNMSPTTLDAELRLMEQLQTQFGKQR
jgi:hypothetical protein